AASQGSGGAPSRPASATAMDRSARPDPWARHWPRRARCEVPPVWVAILVEVADLARGRPCPGVHHRPPANLGTALQKKPQRVRRCSAWTCRGG
ncbi:unnamed protein product, partial [Polarella glacialis]